LEERVMRMRWTVSTASSTPTFPGFKGIAILHTEFHTDTYERDKKSTPLQKSYSKWLYVEDSRITTDQATRTLIEQRW
jgi:hypothetical protein